MSSTPKRRLSESDVLDRLEIHDLVVDYAVAVDERDWATFESLWVPDAHIDYTSAGGITGRPADVTAWLEQAMAMFAMTQHSVSTHAVHLDGERARGRLNVWTRHGIESSGEWIFLDVGGWYEDEYVRTPEGWRFASRVEHTLWFDGAAADRNGLVKVPESARRPTVIPGS